MIEKIQCKIVGTTPYYFNKPWRGRVPKTKKQKQDAADASVYFNGDGCAAAPARQIKGCIKQAISLMKMKVERSNKRAIELVNAALWVYPLDLLVFSPELTLEDLETKEHDIITEKQKLLFDCRYRRIPMDVQWALNFELQLSLLEPDFIREALEAGGAFCGIGGRRQDKNGRFEVEQFGA